jgi:heterotetrameric sarcosine oxidase gamma subunit
LFLERVPGANGQKLADRLRHAIHVAGAATGGAADDALNAAVTVVSEAFVGIRLQGSGAASLLSHGCPLDLELLIPGRCARTLLARAQVLLVPLRQITGYDLFVERNYAEYLRERVALATRI